MRVSFESRYGMWTLDFLRLPLPDLLDATRALMQFARERSDWLIFAPSVNRTPRLFVFAARSLLKNSKQHKRAATNHGRQRRPAPLPLH